MTDTDRPDPRLLGDAPQLGALDRALRGQGLQGPRARLPGLRGRGRGAQRRPVADRGADRAGDHRAPRGGRSAALDAPPILMGHSAGGVFTQILLDHGFGAAGVAINSAPTEGVKRVPLSQVRATFPVLKNPANRHSAVGFTHEQWHYAFTNTLQRGGVARALRALPHPRVRRGSSGAARWPTSSPATRTTLGRLQERRPRAAAVHLRQRGPPHAAEHPAAPTPSTTSRRHDHRDQGVRRARTCCPPGRAGRRSPTTRWTGRSRTRTAPREPA